MRRYYIGRAVSRMSHNGGQAFWYVAQYDPYYHPPEHRRVWNALGEDCYPWVWGFSRLEHAVEILEAFENGIDYQDIKQLAHKLGDKERGIE